MLRHSLITKAVCGIMSLMMLGLSVLSISGSGIQPGKENIVRGDKSKTSQHEPMNETVKSLPNKAVSSDLAHLQITREIKKPNAAASVSKTVNRIEWSEYMMLARIIHAEAGGEPFQGQVAVGAVILNRMRSGKFPRTVTANVMKTGEFESVSNGYIWSNPTESAYRAARLAINGWDPTHGAIYFYNPAKTSSPWIWGRPIITQIGQHNFAV